MRLRLLSLAIAIVPFVAIVPSRDACAADQPAVVLSPRRVERLRANGLNPNDPQLRERLAALARTRRRPAASGVPVLSDAAKQRLQLRAFPPRPVAIAPLPTGSKLPPPVLGNVEWSVGSAYLSGSALLDGTSLGKTTIAFDMGSCGSSTTTPQASSESTYLFFTPPPSIGPRTAKLWVTVDGVASNVFSQPLPTIVLGDLPVHFITGSVADAAPFFSAPAGMPASSYRTSLQSTHVSVDPTAASTQGDDVIGYGVKVVNGWTATASIANVHSYQDASGNGGTNDDFRSARITQQPESGRLETRVHWQFEAGESISYDVVWAFSSGPYYARYIDTMPKQTTCSEEQ